MQIVPRPTIGLGMTISQQQHQQQNKVMTRQTRRRSTSSSNTTATSHFLKTRWVKHQTAMTFFWGFLDFVLALLLFRILDLLIPTLLHVAIPISAFERKSCYWVTTPIAAVFAFLFLGYLLYRSYHNTTQKCMGFFSNEFFSRNVIWAFSQGGVLKNPFLTHLEDVPWVSKTLPTVSKEVAGTINGKQDAWQMEYVASWRPVSAQFILSGKDQTERIVNSDIDALAAASSYIQGELTAKRRPVNTTINLADTKGIEVEVVVSQAKPSAGSLQSFNDSVQADQTARGIKRMMRLNKGKSKEEQISVSDSAAILAGTYKKDVIAVEFKGGDNPHIGEMKFEINAGGK